MESYGMRTDCKRDNRAVVCPNASTLAFGKVTAKRGDWLTYEQDGFKWSGRVLGRVICEGRIYVEMVALLGQHDSPCFRWVEPAAVREIVTSPPRRIWEFMCNAAWADPSNARARGAADPIMKRVEHGFLSDSYLDTYDPENAKPWARDTTGPVL